MRSVLLLFALVIGCGAEDEVSESCPPEQIGCVAGECEHVGLPPDMPCAPGEWLRDEICVPAGIPEVGCGVGFEHDGDRGCVAILPAAPCPPGQMAIMGETRCRAVAPCPSTTWEDIPAEPDNEYVDASYAGTNSDGTASQPWTSIQAAVDAAAPGAIVAIAAGSYLENIDVRDKAVRLWGVCPGEVEVVGTSATTGAVQLLAGTRGSEVRGISIRGATNGLLVFGAIDVVLERLWVHDNAGRGINAQDDVGPTSVTVMSSLVEGNRGNGVFVGSSELTLEGSVVRATQADSETFLGRGLNARAHPTTGVRAVVTVKNSLFEQNRDLGLHIEASDLTVESSVVRTTQPDPLREPGAGVSVESDPVTTAGATLILRSSLVEDNRAHGLFVQGSQATIEGSIVRGTQPDADGLSGRGMNVQAEPLSGVPGTLLLQGSLVDQNRELGIFVEGSNATLEGSVVRGTQSTAKGDAGRGVNVQPNPKTGAPSALLVRGSLIEENHELGVFVTDSQATIESTLVRATHPSEVGLGGHGVNVRTSAGFAPATLLLQSSIVEENAEAGVVVASSNGTIDSCVVRNTHPSATGLYGEGIVVAYEQGPASATITATRIERSTRAGVSVFGAHAAIGCSLLSCQAFDFGVETYHDVAATLDDLGGNHCGCPEPDGNCRAMTANLEPPAPLDPKE